MKRTAVQKKADQKYKERVKQEGIRAYILLDLPIEEKEQIDAYCLSSGVKRLTFIRQAIRDALSQAETQKRTAEEQKASVHLNAFQAKKPHDP